MKYILDIGSSSLRLLAVNKYAGKPRIIAEESVLYDGFIDGEFLTPEKLEEHMVELLQNLSSKIRKPINNIIIGVPNDFCVCVCKRISRKFLTLHKIAEKELQELCEENASFGNSEEYVLINYSPMQFLLDNNYTTLTPVGNKTMALTMDVSYILAKRSFIEMMSEKVHGIGVDEVEFVSTGLGQAMNCQPVKNNKKPFAVVDVGHITTNVSVYKGEGLALMSSFSMGGGHISADLMQLLGLNFKSAELIKRKAILTIESVKNDSYEVCHKGNLIKAPINITNQIIKSRIEMMAKVIKNILNLDDVFNDIDIYLTGDGISNFKGARSIIKEITGLNVYEYKNPFDNSNQKYQTSKTGLAKLANVAI